MDLDNYYRDDIRKVLLCYLKCEPYSGEVSSELWNLLIYHKIDMMYAAVASTIPDSYVKIINSKREEVVNTYHEYMNELKYMIDNFEENNIKYIILKGWANATLLYINPYDRYFGDIDVLICEDDINKVEKIMSDEGYFYGTSTKEGVYMPDRKEKLFQRRYTHEIYNMTKVCGDKYLNFDFNFLFAWRCFGDAYINNVSTDMVYSYSHDIFVRNNHYRVFDVNMQFVHLCCHFTNEALYFALDRGFRGGDPGETKLYRIMDIALLLNKIDINEVKIIAEKLSCMEKIGYAIKIAKIVLGAEYVDKYFKWETCNEEDINYYYEKDGTRKKWPISINNRLFDLKMRNNVFKELFL